MVVWGLDILLLGDQCGTHQWMGGGCVCVGGGRQLIYMHNNAYMTAGDFH